MELAISTASSKVSNSSSATTGPKTSSRAMRMLGVTPREDGRREEGAIRIVAVRERAAAEEELRALGHRDVHVLVRGLDLAGVHLGADLHRLVQAIADFQHFGALRRSAR